MIKEQLYNKTVQILFDAYHNDTLEHGNCHACAVGNIVAASLGYRLSQSGYPTGDKFVWFSHGDKITTWWDEVFMTPPNYNTQMFYIESYSGEAKREIDSTGYTPFELAKIEYAFETAPKGNSSDEYMFNGLCSVLEVLKQIHEISDDEPVRKKFNDHYLTLAK